MKLFHSPASPFVRKVLVVAHERGLAGQIETVGVGVTPVSTPAEVAGANPLGKIPALILDDGSTLFDSRVICEYLDTLGSGPALFPAPGPQRWAALRRQATADGMTDAGILCRYERAIRPAEKQWDGWVDGQMGKVTRALDALEAEAKAGALAGFDIGAISIACAIGWFDFRMPELGWRTSRPALAAWLAGLASRPSLAATAPR
ncbi:MAG: glutathione S-transferase [Thalassobaculales bacterium]